jgi:hypothetical protein
MVNEGERVGNAEPLPQVEVPMSGIVWDRKFGGYCKCEPVGGIMLIGAGPCKNCGATPLPIPIWFVRNEDVVDRVILIPDHWQQSMTDGNWYDPALAPAGRGPFLPRQDPCRAPPKAPVTLTVVHRDERDRQSVLSILRGLIEEAEAGKISGVHIAAFYPDENGTDGGMRTISSNTVCITERIGSLVRLILDLHDGR